MWTASRSCRSGCTAKLLLLFPALLATANASLLPPPRCPSPTRHVGVAAVAAQGSWAALDYDTISDHRQPPAVVERLLALTAVEAVAELCSRNVTAAAYAMVLLLRVKETECLNAWAAVDARRVVAEAEAIDALAEAGGDIGPLCGLPVGA